MKLHNKSLPLNTDIYDIVKQYLKDDFYQVRLVAAKIIFLLACSYPNL